MNKLLMLSALLIALIACESSNTKSKNNSDLIAAIDTMHTDTIKKGNSIKNELVKMNPEFIKFWEGLKARKAETNLLETTAYFPYAYASFENMVIDKSNFYDATNDITIFNHLFERESLDIYELSEGYLNGFLNEELTKIHGNLDGIHVIESSPEPIGYLVYFKEIDGKWRFVGCELIEIGD